MTTLAEISKALSEPFALEDIGFLPKGKVERDGKTLCMALPYADPRAYEDRLNTLAPGEWSTPAPTAVVAGNKLICYVSVVVCGVVHSDVGEAFLRDNNKDEENTATEAWAQAFKRACSQFGLGRYLYDLEKEWVPFNPQKKQIDLDKAGQRAIVQKMYRKAGIGVQAEAVQQHENGHHRVQTSFSPSSNGKAVSVPPQREEAEVASPVPEKPKALTWNMLYALGKQSGRWQDLNGFTQALSEKFGRLIAYADLNALTQGEVAEVAKSLEATTGDGGGH